MTKTKIKVPNTWDTPPQEESLFSKIKNFENESYYTVFKEMRRKKEILLEKSSKEYDIITLIN